VSLPRITVITPSFNQAEFIRETLESVLDQGYPDLEYFVADAGSTDGTLQILEEFAPRLSWWVSEKDRGQSHAINKGLARATGDVVAWLNSDDLYQPGALRAVGEAFRDRNVEWVTGSCVHLYPDGSTESLPPDASAPVSKWLWYTRVSQPATFWRRSLHDRVGYIDESLHFGMDKDLFVRFLLEGATPHVLNQDLATFRHHPASKTRAQRTRFYKDAVGTIIPRYYARLKGIERLRTRRVAARSSLALSFSLARTGEYAAAARYFVSAHGWNPAVIPFEVVASVSRRLG
jgi:glycosyltransferase involved in cell wall biosynthesis